MLCGTVQAAEFKVGVSRVAITPKAPIWMQGYAARTHPSEGTVHDLWAKALAMDDGAGGRVVIVSTELIGLPREVSDEVAARVAKKHGLNRSQLVLNSSHTHCGPEVWPGLPVMFDFPPADVQVAAAYSRKLTDELVQIVGAALANMQPAQVAVAHGSVGFGMNRRQVVQKAMQIGENRKGPVDHDVPVVKITGPDGKLRAILFGYACHCTTLGGDFYRFNGDYAGFAQIELEKAHPGATAMFLALCGADQNPSPRGKLEMAAEHGKAMAKEICRVLSGPFRPVRPPIRTAYEVVELKFAPHERRTFEEQAKNPNPYLKRRAKLMLAAYDAGRPPRAVAYPVQAVRWNDDLALLALGGEVVVDYALRLKREFPKENLIVAGYSNDVMCYIPSLRVLKEGGYESVDSMIYYGQPGPFAESVEQTVIDACRRVLKCTGATVSP
jgi:hypothetical protein